MSEQPFDWFNWLEVALKKRPTDEEHDDAMDRAHDWPSCACGQLCGKLPRNSQGEPFDPALRKLGQDFFDAICDRDYEQAVTTMRDIEKRTAELLKPSPT